MPPIVRPAVVGDAPAIARLLGQLGYPVEAIDVPERLERLRRRECAEVLLAWDGDRAVGLATIHVLSVLNRPRDVAQLTALVVDETARGGGIGRVLVDAVERWARAAGCERLSVTTHEDRAGAQAFYPAIGMPLTGRRYGRTL